MTILGYMLDTQFNLPTPGQFETMPEGLLGHTLRWDSGWYMEIIRSNFYQHTTSAGAIYAFYPLYPLLIAIGSIGTLGLLSPPYVSFIINTVAIFFIIIGLMAVLQHFKVSRRTAQLTTLLFITSPAGIFLHVFYGEAVFIALATWAYLFALQRKWHKMAIILGILSAARLPAVLFIGLCALEFLRSHSWRLTDIFRQKESLWFLLAPLGFILYSAWSFHTSGDWLAMFHAYKAPDGWPYQIFSPNIIVTLVDTITTLAISLHSQGLDKFLLVNYVLPLGSLFALLASSLYALRAGKQLLPLGIFGLLAFVMFTLNGNIISVHRYALACISIFIVCAVILSRHPAARPIALCVIPLFTIAQAGLLVLFVTGHFAG